MNTSRHITTRRGFVAALGFGGVSLYGLWAAYGAAPGPSALLRRADVDDHKIAVDAGHGGMPAGTDVESFRAEVAAFVERYEQDDGSVYPRMEAAEMPNMDMSGMSMIPAADAAAAKDHGGHGGDASVTATPTPIDVPMLAERWFYEPAHLRLDIGTAYQFRLMTTDIPHGASIQFGRGARMIRLSPGAVTTVALTFTRPGIYLVYCTAYCGVGHDAMQARIDVV